MTEDDIRSLIEDTVMDMLSEGILSLEHDEEPGLTSTSHTISLTLNDSRYIGGRKTLDSITLVVDRPED